MPHEHLAATSGPAGDNDSTTRFGCLRALLLDLVEAVWTAPDSLGQHAGAEQQAEQAGLVPLDGELPGEGEGEHPVAERTGGLPSPQQPEGAAEDSGETRVLVRGGHGKPTRRSGWRATGRRR